MKNFVIIGLFVMGTCFLSGCSKRTPCIFFSDTKSSAKTLYEVPYEGTHKQIEKKSFYLHIRYPVETPGKNGKGPILMKFSVGNETDQLLVFEVKALSIIHPKKTVRLEPEFYDQDQEIVIRGLEPLLKYRNRVIPNLHREIKVFVSPDIRDCQEVKLQMLLVVHYNGQKELVSESIPLYQNTFEP